MSNSDVLAQMLESYNRDDVDGVVARADDDVEYVFGARGIRVTGPDQWRAVMAAVAAACPGRRLRVLRQVVSGDDAAFEWVLEGTSSGQMPGFPPAGERVRSEGCSVLGFRNGRIVYWRDFMDLVT